MYVFRDMTNSLFSMLQEGAVKITPCQCPTKILFTVDIEHIDQINSYIVCELTLDQTGRLCGNKSRYTNLTAW